MKIVPVELQDLSQFRKPAEREGILFSNKSQYFAVVAEGGRIIGMSAILYMGSQRAMLKCEYVLPEFRRKGLLDEMIKHRLNLIASKMIYIAEAHCTAMSVKAHINNGATVLKKYKNGITQVIYRLK